MAILWQSSHFPFIDPNGEPYSGAKAYFFDANTTTPRTVYRESGLGEAHDHPVIANASGMFPAVFLPEGDYRVRVEDADGVVLFDTDGISTPSMGESGGGGGGGGGDTDPTLLLQTGMYIFSHRTGPLSGWVRANGRTIGNAVSGATERANDDCQGLFQFLWSQDATLTVSGGRGASAAGDWAAGKTMTLPDLRLRALIGMASMGNTASTVIPAANFDNSEDGDKLGATVGVGAVTLTIPQMPTHAHTGTTSSDGAHSHPYTDQTVAGSGNVQSGGSFLDITILNKNTGTAGQHGHTLNIATAGGGEAHTNVQPSAVATAYIKL